MTALVTIGQVGGWIWFAVAWVFILAVAFKRWRARERRDAARTKEILKATRYDTTGAHIWDA